MALLALCGLLAAAIQEVDFQAEVRPLLADRCFQCHGPNERARKSGLRLDTLADATADLGGYAAVVSGDTAQSELLLRVAAADPRDRMPPPKAGPPLSAGEIALLQRWIRQGAAYEPHWGYQPPNDPEAPPVAAPGWARDPLDRFVQARIEAAGLQPAPEAGRATWLRRASFALTGLPPSREEIVAFAADAAPGAHGRVVERLLASPHFGERMAQPWLDYARYADTYGYQSDVERRVWPYRDWVIEAYNDNLPYDQFLRWQLAGDLLSEATREQRIATAFNRLHRQTNEGGSIEEEYRVEYVSDRAHTAGTAFLGMTIECARCHDHKFEPVSQREYYSFSALFDDIDESGLYSHFTSATPTPAMDLPSAEQEAALAAAEAAVAAAEQALEGARTAAGAPGPDEEGAAAAPTPRAWYSFDERTEQGFPDTIDPARFATAEDGIEHVDGVRGRALRFDGDHGARFPGAGEHRRSDPFTVELHLKLDRQHERAVVLHRSRAWTDAGSQGWQLLIEDGRLTAALVHFWPGDAIAIRTRDALPLGRWIAVRCAYDGSSRAGGLRLDLDGAPAETEIVRDRLTRSITGGGPGAPTAGARFRDRGLAGGCIDELRFYAAALPPQPATVSPAEAEAAEALRAARRARDDLRDAIPQLMVMEQTAEPRQAWLLGRGSYAMRESLVEPGAPAVLTPPGADRPRDRLELAEWMLHPEHPRTARIEADRLWRAVFGRGLVPTPEDFGSQGTPPTHPALLDYLARELRRSDWDRKALLARLVLSATFRQSSAVDAARGAADPGNLLWSRGPSRRLPAEMLRDAALAASGLLVRQIGGPSVKPYQPAGLWQEKSGNVYRQDSGEGLYRRSLYTFWKRTSPPPAMMILDAAKRDVCVARRQTTNTPLQALVLWNDPQIAEAARVLAARVLAEPHEAEGSAAGNSAPPDTARLDAAFLLLAGRRAEAAERAALEQLLFAQRAHYTAAPDQAEAVRAVGESLVPSGLDPAEHAAWTAVCAALLASDPVVMLR